MKLALEHRSLPVSLPVARGALATLLMVAGLAIQLSAPSLFTYMLTVAAIIALPSAPAFLSAHRLRHSGLVIMTWIFGFVVSFALVGAEIINCISRGTSVQGMVLLLISLYITRHLFFVDRVIDP
jgi:hypothetical protein